MIQRLGSSISAEKRSIQCKIWIIATGNSVNSPVKFKSNFRFPDIALNTRKYKPTYVDFDIM